jgi:hypothetical protein
MRKNRVERRIGKEERGGRGSHDAPRDGDADKNRESQNRICLGGNDHSRVREGEGHGGIEGEAWGGSEA